jgi:uncharacterized LabA/DUF88 family protein
MLEKFIKGKTAVFIDAANIELSAKDLNFRIDYKKLYNWLKKEADLNYLGFYTVRFETKNHDGFLTVLKKTGYHLVTKPLKIIKAKKDGVHLRKANFDVEIAVEIIKRINNFDTFILFSGVSDFHYLVKELKKNNKKIIIASLKYHVSKELVESADYYLDLRRVKDKIKR